MERLKKFSLLLCNFQPARNGMVFFEIVGGSAGASRSESPDRAGEITAEAKLTDGEADFQMMDLLRKQMEKKVGLNNATAKTNELLGEKDVQTFISDVARTQNVDTATIDSKGMLKVMSGGSVVMSLDLSRHFGGMRTEAAPRPPSGREAAPGRPAERAPVVDEHREAREVASLHARERIEHSEDLRRLNAAQPATPERTRAQQTYQDKLSTDKAANNNRAQNIAEADRAGKDYEDLESKIPGRLATSSIGKDVDYYKTYRDIWRSHDGSYEIDQLLSEDPGSEYGSNPFKEQKWDTEKMRQLFDDANSALTFEDVANELYETQIAKIQAQLKAQGVHEDVVKAMDNDLMDAYADVKEMKASGKYGDSPDKALAVLGDYISYSSRLVKLVGKLRYNAASAAESADSDNAFDSKTPTAEALRAMFGKENTGAYLVVMNAARQRELGADGKWKLEISEPHAIAKLNQILSIGMATYDGDAKYSQESLKITSISELTTDSPLNQARAVYLKEGYDTYARETEKGNEAEYNALQNSKIKLSETQADQVVDGLRKSGVHDEAKLAQIKKNLTLGVGLMLPTGGNKTGYGVGLEYQFDNNISIGFGFALPEAGFPPDPQAVALGPSIGYKVELNKDVDISFRLGAAYNTGGGGMESGFGGAAGTRITFKGEDMDWYIQAGVGSFGVPGIVAGAGVDWRKSNEQYLQSLDKKQVESGVKEIDATGTPYETVKGNPGKYVLVEGILDPIEKLDMPDASKKAIFEAEYDKFKEKLSKQSLEDTSKAWYESFIPTGAGAGFIFLFGELPIPYVTLNFDIDGSVEVHRVQTSDAKANAISNAQLEEALSKRMAGKKVHVHETSVKVNGEFTFENGEMKLAKTREGHLDFSKLMDNNDNFRALRNELKIQCDILVEKGGEGRVKIEIDKADGDTKIFIDPRLGDKAILIHEGDKLYLSLAKDANLTAQRKDVVFQNEVNKVGEETTIVIGDGSRPDFKNAIKQSSYYLHRLPGQNWVRRPHDDGTGEAKPAQENLTDTVRAMPDRVEFKDNRMEIENRQDAYDGLIAELSSGEGSSLKAPTIRGEVKAAVEKLGKDIKLLTAIRKIVTESTTKSEGQLLKDYESLMVLIGNALDKANVKGTQLFERQYVFAQLFNKTLPKNISEKEYRTLMNGFERTLLTKVVGNTETVDWIMNQIKDIPVDEKGVPTKIGSSNDMLGGTLVTGRAQWTTTDHHAGMESYNMVRPTVIDESTDPNAKRMTEFYLAGRRKNFDSGAVDVAVANPSVEVAKRINDQMQTAFSLLLMKILPAELSNKEMQDMKALYHSDFKGITADNLPTLKKVMGYINMVMNAEKNGQKEVNITPETKIVLDPTVTIGLIQACRNFNGNVQEGFALLNTRTRQFMVSGAQTEFLKSETKSYSRTDMGVMLGVAIPLPVSHDVGGPQSNDDGAVNQGGGALPAEVAAPAEPVVGGGA